MSVITSRTEELSTFRVDLADFDDVKPYIDNYVLKHKGTKYLINSEISDEVHKEHFQGWIYHPNVTQHSYNKHFNSEFKKLDLEKHQRSFAVVEKPKTYYSYILNNEMKPQTSYKDVHTNYTEEEFNVFKSFTPFIELPQIPVKKGRASYTRSYQDKVLDALEENCVIDGIIQYDRMYPIYMKYAPIRLSERIIYENLVGYTNRLEQKYPANKRVNKGLYNGVCRLDDENRFFCTRDTSRHLKHEDL